MPEIDLSAAWIASGNRTHPNLRLIDELRKTSTYDGCEEDLDVLERAHLNADEFTFDETLFSVKEKEKVFYGDRSHERLVKLDSIRESVTYDGWKKDFKDAEQEHFGDFASSFMRRCESMKRKQAIHEGDYSHQDLQCFYSLNLTYPDWDHDFDEAMDTHKDGFDSGEQSKLVMVEKQKMHEGDRSHPRLVSLDICSSFFNYDGWKADVQSAEEMHLQLFDSVFPENASDRFTSFLKILVRKQRKHETGMEDNSTMHPIQRKIMETHWSYPGWEADMDEISQSFYTNMYEEYLETCQLKQMIHLNDFNSHPALIKLSAMELSYPGWEQDFEDAKDCLCRWGYHESPYHFDRAIKGMKNKQDLYSTNIEGGVGEECCICMTDLRENSVKKLKCGHFLHTNCLNEMIGHQGSVSHRSCPLCRAPIE